ncbi:hypothetical protein BDR07DRAFT_1422119 [Suillus spraguei]|nr:hypothetical protein BDR07DRAFT_1422119 [Suillus spraguei]
MQINMRRKLCVSKNAGGQTVTSETALQLPLTYYGPSVSGFVCTFVSMAEEMCFKITIHCVLY